MTATVVRFAVDSVQNNDLRAVVSLAGTALFFWGLFSFRWGVMMAGLVLWGAA